MLMVYYFYANLKIKQKTYFCGIFKDKLFNITVSFEKWKREENLIFYYEHDQLFSSSFQVWDLFASEL